MTVTEDIRVKKTKQKLFAAYLQLLTKKAPADITIQLLTKEADINRVTFYKHFQHIANFHDAFVSHYLEELYTFMKPLNYKTYQKASSTRHYLNYLTTLNIMRRHIKYYSHHLT